MGILFFMNTTFYFPHDFNAGQDYKIIALISKHSASGYGIYWRIIEMLHSDDSHTLPNNEMIWNVISTMMKVPFEEVKTIIETCIEYKLLHLQDGIIYSTRVNYNIEHREQKKQQKKDAGRKSAENRIKQMLNDSSTDVQHTFNERSTDAERLPNKGKERKGKEKKVNIYSDEYERFWIAYGRKGNKNDGFKHFQALTDAEKQQALDCIQPYFNSQPDAKFRKDIERYIAKKHWESFLSTSTSGEVKVEVMKVLPNFANQFTFSLWNKIPKETTNAQRWQWYRENRPECSEVYQHCQKFRDREQEEYLLLPDNHKLKIFIFDYIKFAQHENSK